MILQKVLNFRYWYRKLFSNRLFLADIISAVEFDHTGDYLATGDKGGRVVLFERNESVSLYELDFSNLYIYILKRKVNDIIEKILWISFSYRVSIPWTRIWLFKEFGNWRKDQSNQMV